MYTRVESIETDLPRVGPSSSGLSTLPQISETQESIDIHMEDIDADLNAANDNDPKNVTNIRTDVDNKELKFSDDEEDAINAKDDPENQFYEIDETVKKQKISTQTTKTIEAFRQKYRKKLEDEDEDVQAITPEFTTALDEFILTSLAKWKWSSDAEHKANIKEWADKMKEKDCSTKKRSTSSV
jgi:ribonuclease BN (tRNA processing enzyme)